MGLESRERTEQQECLLLVFVGRKLLLKPIVDVQQMMVNREFIPLQPLVKPMIIGLNYLKLQLDLLGSVVILELHVGQHAFSLLIVFEIIIETFTLRIITQHVLLGAHNLFR